MIFWCHLYFRRKKIKLDRSSVLDYLKHSNEGFDLNLDTWDCFFGSRKIQILLTRTLSQKIRKTGSSILNPIDPSKQINLSDLHVERTEGERTLEDGTIEKGCFEDDVLAHGIRTKTDGTIESGEFVDGKLVGGIRKLPEGTLEIGSFKNGQLDGSDWHGITCRRIHPNGTIESGKFKEGIFIEDTSQARESSQHVTPSRQNMPMTYTRGGIFNNSNSRNPQRNSPLQQKNNPAAATTPETIKPYQIPEITSKIHHALSGSGSLLLEERDLSPIDAAPPSRSLQQVLNACKPFIAEQPKIGKLSNYLSKLEKNTPEPDQEYSIQHIGYSSHTAYAVYEKLDENHTCISIYNTGSGSDLHEKVGNEKNHILPLRIKIPNTKRSEESKKLENCKNLSELHFKKTILKLKNKYSRLSEMSYRESIGRDIKEPLEQYAYRAQVAGTCTHESLMALVLDRCGREDFLKIKQKELEQTAQEVNIVAAALFSQTKSPNLQPVRQELNQTSSSSGLGKVKVTPTPANFSQILNLQFALLSQAISDVSVAIDPTKGRRRKLQVGFIYP